MRTCWTHLAQGKLSREDCAVIMGCLNMLPFIESMRLAIIGTQRMGFGAKTTVINREG